MAQGDTTVRVSRETRDEVRRLAAERGVSADQVLAEALRLTRWESLRRQAEREIAEAAADPADRAELAAAVRELTGARE
ncbi:hypothetical protein [Blastococcus brunescens]|uniref:Ribbon-helix-helix protein, CopG family n=1 Tax=Blastococcus brunescens TaxID=1564165 RepID=A0ABZ1B6Q7_9ACTN|nr:hypothetical protein [Blastococcus sp. BMG 8361]WRL66062.1 hypothetical protein U6N30_11270 [Blastococcus sp. BMG 8361]